MPAIPPDGGMDLERGRLLDGLKAAIRQLRAVRACQFERSQCGLLSLPQQVGDIVGKPQGSDSLVDWRDDDPTQALVIALVERSGELGIVGDYDAEHPRRRR